MTLSSPGPATPRFRPAFLASAVAWGGAALFVISLAFFLYAYLVLYGAPSSAGSRAAPIAIDVAMFSMFALHHSVFARPAVKLWLHRMLPPTLERSFFTWVASALFLGVCWWWQAVPGDLYRMPHPWRWLGYAAQGGGIALTFFGSRAIDVLDLGGVRPLLNARSGHGAGSHVPLVTSGAYRVVRHPIYFGWVLLVCGIPDMTATRFTFAAISTFYLALAIPLEERGLRATFGPEYADYCRQVRWRMVPGLY